MIDEAKKRIIDETIVSSLVGQRIDRVISLVADIPRAAAAQIIDAGAVLLDDVIVKAGKIKVTEGQHLVIDLTLLPEKQLPAAEPNIKVDVVYADDDLIVINKQAGIVVHPGAGNPTGTLVNAVLALYPEIATVG
ncbi:MAG: hypothetical protein F2884_04450, partial [Actinobacteria bacterium]|nr:hypothetical protein [Actinomycetota bacterium]